MKLDFSKLEGLAQKNATVENPEEPFKASQPQDDTNVPLAAERRSIGRSDVLQTYKKMYRAAWNFHEAHMPPAVDHEYWKTHTPGKDEAPPAETDYWEKTAQDIAATADSYGNDPFITGLLTAIMEELEREYERRRS